MTGNPITESEKARVRRARRISKRISFVKMRRSRDGPVAEAGSV